MGIEVKRWLYPTLAIATRHRWLCRGVLLLVAHVANDACRSPYAIWSGVGIVLITLMAWIVLGQSLDRPAVIGLALIVAGVVVSNVFSKSAINQLH